MGVPKFFRYISERYPCLSEVVKEYQLPEFDNLYLDMNGIIHVCSHPNDNDPHFRITEEKIFRDIFHYIETLFRMIQPQKLFFMAVDGVAPRAKMNQQRGRRFRSAKDAEMAEERAKLRGEELPSVDRFDSNCITPGTEFMTRLQAQLKYFVTFKVSTDKLWQKVKVILSGHETPGEGEHKIMDYIRYMKAQPGYASDTRHCLYGLDADLIMLGLCTHEPHFSLLREEVKYGKQNNQKRIPTPEETTFFLLHLSLMREYLELEFQQLKNTLPFPFDLEHIIDDWVLMGFLVGNDFIPHLPDLHINKGAFPILYKTYIDVLPTLKGYINQGGTLQLDRFQKYMEKLAAFDLEQFKEVSADLKYFEGKTGRRPGGKERHSYKPEEEPISPLKNKDLAALIASTEEILEGSEDDDKNYIDVDSDEEDEDGTSFAEFCAHKKNYYIEKLEYEKVTPEVLRSQGEGYVRAIQWNLNYYYNGCCSWSWFFPHHYAPYISDIKNFSGLKLEYDLGQPFLPFQQLLAVLPAASKKLLPHAYHDLMENETSPIIDFYPTQFKTDLNGKRQDWEAVVLIPFIDQESLLDAMDTKESQLTEEERSRNKHGPMQIYSYTPDNLGSYIAPAYFPALANHHAKEENLNREQLSVEQSKLVRGLCPGVKLDVYFPGFPTLKHIPFSAELQKAKTKVFESASQGDNMILTILPQGHPDVNEVATQLMGKSIFVNWPHLLEARVIAVSNEEVRFSLHPENNSVIEEKMSKAMQAQWDLSKSGIEDRYFSRMGIEVGKTEILVYACTLEDKKFVMADDKMHYEKQWSKFPIAYALQTTRTNIAVYEPTSDLTLTVDQIFPPNSTVFGMDQVHYGFKGTVLDGSKNQRVKVSFLVEPEPDLEQIKDKLKRMAPTYLSGSTIAHRLNISSHILSRITGTIFVMSGEIQETERRPFKLNIGLNLKFNKRNEEVCGYTRRNKGSDFWMYSVKAGEEIRDYLEAFPEVFDFLKRESGSMDVHSTDIYPENTEEKLAKLGGWLKERSSAKAERQTCGAEVLEENMVLALEEHIDDFLKNQVPVQPSIVNIKPANLYVPKPKLGQSPDVKAEHHLFDRIINVRESNTVPLGAKGTIIGIHDAEKGPEAIFDIVFDKEFTGGLKLRSSPHRGYRLPGQAFINLSYGQARNSNRAPSKPTAIVEPSGTEEEGNNWNKHGHNSAFASWRNKPTQNSDLALQYEGEHRGRRVGTDSHYSRGGMDHGGRTRHYIPPNPCHHSAPQQLSTEYLAMFKQLQKAGQNNKGYGNTKGPNQSVEDSSSALKKMLKIADNTSKKPISPANTTIPTWNVSKNHSYCMQLLSLHQRMGCKLPQYHYADTRDGAIICTVTCFNGQEFRGDLAYANDPAAESAARRALEDHKGFGSNASAPFHPSSRPPPLMNSPQVPGVASSNRIPNTNWREPAKPSTLPQPPTNWYKIPRGASNFYPDWGAGSLPQYHPNLYNSQGQSNQLPLWQPHRPPFIPLQAETRGRPRQPTRSAASVHTTEGVSVRMPPSSAINTGRNPMKPTRTRIAANFNKGFSSSSPSGNSQ